jgi:prevent-host-death family protein
MAGVSAPLDEPLSPACGHPPRQAGQGRERGPYKKRDAHMKMKCKTMMRIHCDDNRTLTWLANRTSLSGMKTVNVHEAKTHFSSLLAKLEKDSQSIVICRNGRPVADLVPHRRTNRIKAHFALGKIKIGYDPIKPLSVADWPEAAR